MMFIDDVVKAATPLITLSESFQPKPYVCPAGHLTVGYGFTLGAVSAEDLKRTWTRKEADAKLDEQLRNVYYPLLTAKVPESSLQRMGCNRAAALLSAVFNLGTGGAFGSVFLKRIKDDNEPKNTDKYDAWASHLLKYHYSGKNRLPGLANRRRAEAIMLKYNKPFNPTDFYKYTTANLTATFSYSV